MRERSKLPMLLTELTVMLLIFALCAAVCLSAFFSSKRTARESGELSHAAAWAQSAAEAWSAAGGVEPDAAESLGAVSLSGLCGFTLTLDEDWQPADGGNVRYRLLLVADGFSGGAEITVRREEGEDAESGSGGEIFSLYVRAVTYG